MKRKFYLIAVAFIFVFILSLSACNPDVEVKEFTVTVVNGSGGVVFKENSTCTVTATIGENKEFVEWQADGVSVSKDNPYSFAVTQNITLTAVTKDKDVKPNPDPDPTPIELGVFARKWIGKDKESGILDFVNGIWSIADDFKIVSVSGEGKDTVIACVADDISYNITLTTQGLLKVTDAEYDELFHLFMPSADPFNGLWQLQDEDVYALFIAELNEDNLFGWALVDSDGNIDSDYLITATTKFVFDNNGNAQLQFVNDFNITYTFDGSGNLIAIGEDLTYIPTDKMFESSYVSNDGTIYTLNVNDSKITVNGVQSSYVLQCGQFGVGIYFSYNIQNYGLIQTLDGVALYSANGHQLLKTVDSARYNGVWQGKYMLTITDGVTATLNGQTATLTTAVIDGELYLSFTIGASVYTVYPVGESEVSLYLECSDEAESGYYVSNVVPNKFVGSYVNETGTLSISNDLTVTIGTNVFDDGALVVLPNLDRVEAVSPNGFIGLQQIALAFDNASKYLIWFNDGVAVLTDTDDCAIQSAYYTASALQDLKDKFLDGLSSELDKYTIGGTNRFTLELDFASGNVVIDGTSVPFAWNYAVKATGDEYAVITFTATVLGEMCDCTLYPYFNCGYLRLETKPTGSTKKAVIRNMTSLSEYEQLLGTSYYVKDGEYTNSLKFENDGTLIVTNAKQNLVERHTEYELTRDDKSGVLVVTFFEIRSSVKFEVSVFCDIIGVSVAMVTDIYVNEALLEVIGSYFDTNNKECLEFLANTKYKLDGNGIESVLFARAFESIVIKDGKVTCVFDGGVIVFENGIATVTYTGGTSAVYTKQNKLPQEATPVPPQFIGEYRDGDGRVYVEVLADNMFLYNTDGDGIIGSTQAVKFDKVTIDGDTVTCEKTYTNGVFSYTVTFVFNGNSVTVYDTDNDPVTYTKTIQ